MKAGQKCSVSPWFAQVRDGFPSKPTRKLNLKNQNALDILWPIVYRPAHKASFLRMLCTLADASGSLVAAACHFG
jgi:hypothetical protein